jgi:hypothetical protein
MLIEHDVLRATVEKETEDRATVDSTLEEQADVGRLGRAEGTQLQGVMVGGESSRGYD